MLTLLVLPHLFARFNGSTISLDGVLPTLLTLQICRKVYIIQIVSADSDGNQVTSTEQLVVDTTAPVDVLIGIPNSSSGLTVAERASAVDVTITPEAGADVVSVSLDGSQLSEVVDNIFRIENASSIAGGFHQISVISQDAAGNQKNTVQEVMFVGGSTALSDMFEFKSTSSSGTVTVEAYVKNFASSLGDGIKSLSFWLDLNASQANYTEGSFQMLAEGAFYLSPNENGVKGDVFSSVAFGTAWNSFDEPFFSFSAYAPNASSVDLDLVDFTLYTTGMAETNYGTISTSFDI